MFRSIYVVQLLRCFVSLPALVYVEFYVRIAIVREESSESFRLGVQSFS